MFSVTTLEVRVSTTWGLDILLVTMVVAIVVIVVAVIVVAATTLMVMAGDNVTLPMITREVMRHNM